MSTAPTCGGVWPPEQEAIRQAYRHPTTPWQAFQREETEQSVGARFEKVVGTRPDHIALDLGGREVTYSDLNTRANRVAHALLETSPCAEDDTVVAILTTDGLLGCAGVLGALKAGIPFVTIDPTLPPERVRLLVDDSGANRFLVDAATSKTVAPRATEAKVHLDDTADFAATNPVAHTSADQVALISYTSGSTGRPKGVANSHRNVLQCVLRVVNGFLITPDDRRGIVNGFAAGVSVLDILVSLLSGGTAVVYDMPALGVTGLGQWFREERITLAVIVTTVYRQLVAQVESPGTLPHLRILILGGEAVAPSDIESFRDKLAPGCSLSVGFGVTEHVGASFCFFDADRPIADDEMPSGYPLEGVELRILDEQGLSVPGGQVGEVAICNPHVALGYWRQPGLTRSRFLDEPQSARRVYLTGDRGKVRADGCLVHLGRIDSQVKIRGHRVEPAEVEAALMNSQFVALAAVVARPDLSGELRLLAYIVPSNANDPGDRAALRRVVAEQLPAHMVPSRFTFIAALPQTETGKIDRNALPDPGPEQRETSVQSAAPDTPTQIGVAAIWAEILELEPVGLHDEFVDLGGDSLQAMQVAAKINETFGLEIPFPELFAASTVEAMTLAVLRATKSGRDAHADSRLTTTSLMVAIQPKGARPPLFMVPPAGATAMRLGALAKHLGPDQPLFGFQPAGLDGGEPDDTVTSAATAYANELQRHQPHGPYLLGGMCFGFLVALEMARVLETRGESVPILISLDSSVPAFGPSWIPAGTRPKDRPQRSLRYYGSEFLRRSRNGTLVRWLLTRPGILLRRWHYHRFARGHRDTMPRVLAAQEGAQRTYHARPVASRVCLLRSAQRAGQDEIRRWKELAPNGVEDVVFEGTTHRSLLLEDHHVEPIAKTIRELLAQVATKHGKTR